MDSKCPRTDSHVIWEVYCSWYADGTLYSKTQDTTTAQVSLRSERDLLLKSYFYGDKLGDTGFQDAVIDAIIQQSAQHPRLLLEENHVERVYEYTGKGDMLRAAFVTVITYRLPLGHLKQLLASAEPEEFRDELRAACQLGDTEREELQKEYPDILGEVELGVADIDSVCLKRGWQKPHPWVIDPCQFHRHGKGGCPATSTYNSASSAASHSPK